MPQDWELPSIMSRPLSRRSLLRIAGIGAGGALLAACAKSTSSPSPTSASKKLSPGSSALSKSDIDFIRQIFGGSPKAVGQGLTIPVGAGLLLSTSQAVYGQQSLKGMHLAAAQIKAAGGPTFTFNVQNLSASTTAGATAVTDWHASKIAMGLGAGFFGTGSMLPGMAEYKILVIDPGGGTSTVFQDKPYAWGGRAITPNDAFPGTLEWMKLKMPKASRFGVTGYNLGALTTGAIAQLNKQGPQFGPRGSHVVGDTLVPEPGTGTDNWPAAIAALRNMNPDVIWNWVWGSDPATFMKAYAPSGMSVPVIGPDYQASSDSLAGPAFYGYMFAFDYFNPNDPKNPWAKMFINAYEATYNESPNYYPANYYEEMFVLWELVKRVIAAGGNINNGTDLQTALISNPKFASVYGSGSETGSLVWNTTTHTLARRPMGLFKVGSGFKIEPLAYFNIGGVDFRLA